MLTALDRQPGATPRLLVSNAGVWQWGSDDGVLAERYAQIVALNCAATVALTTPLLPRLQADASPAVVHVSSQPAYQPVHEMAVCCASKTFVHHFSLVRHENHRQHGVLVQTLVPAPTATELDSKAGAQDNGVQKRGQADDVVRASPCVACGARLWYSRADQRQGTVAAAPLRQSGTALDRLAGSRQDVQTSGR